MPFKSEKQRRFLWAEHPEIAKRWADKYPESNKGLPMYANDKDDKTDSKSTKNAIYGDVVENRHKQIRSILSDEPDQNLKVADSKQEKVDMPQSEKPVYAGEEREKGMISGGINTSAENNESCGENAINTLLQKLSVVLSPHVEQTIENMNAENEGRVPRRVGRNAGLKQYPVATPQIPLPMGMQPPQAQSQPQQSKQSKPASPTPVGAGQSSATTDPIKFHSGLSASGIINGNAALSAPNTVNTKISALVEKWAEIGLWDRIRAKKKRGEKPAKPGDKDYPDSKSWNKVTAISEKSSMAGNEILSQLMGMNSVSECDIADLLELEADERTPTKLAEVLTKWAGTPAWQRAAGKNDEGGLNAKGRASYNRATGGNLKAPVTEKNPSGSRAKRQNSFCSRMCGMKSKETGAKTKADPDSRINKALRKWNCKCGSEKTAALDNYLPETANTLVRLPSALGKFLLAPTAAGVIGGAGYGALNGGGVARGALRGGLIGAGAGAGNMTGMAVPMALGQDLGAGDQAVSNIMFTGGAAGSLGGALGGNQLYNVLERMYDKHREKKDNKKQPEKEAYDWQGRRQSTNVVDRTQDVKWEPGVPDRTTYGLRMPTWNNFSPVQRITMSGKPGRYVSDTMPDFKTRVLQNQEIKKQINSLPRQDNEYTRAVDRFAIDNAGKKPVYGGTSPIQSEIGDAVMRYQPQPQPQPQLPQYKFPPIFQKTMPRMNIPASPPAPTRQPNTTPPVVQQKAAQEFDPALSRDAENAILHGTGLVGSGALGAAAGMVPSMALDSAVSRAGYMPDAGTNPYGHAAAKFLVNMPAFVGSALGMRLYDQYIMKPHMKREIARKQEEERLRQQADLDQMMPFMVASGLKKRADASLQRILGTALASTGGGLLLGSYPGWKLQRASEAAGNSDFTNFVAGKAPIALAGALSAGAYNHWLDQYEKKPKHKKKEPPAHPSLKYVQYLVH